MKLALAVAAALVAAFPAFADDITVEDSFALVSRPNAPAGAVFMVLKNAGEADTLIGASTSVAERVELHTHIKDGDIIRMRQAEGGFDIEANGERTLERGGDHVMMLGLTQSLEVGSEIEVTLTFEQAGELVITVPVKDGKAAAHGHSDHGDLRDHAGHGDEHAGHGDHGDHSGHGDSGHNH